MHVHTVILAASLAAATLSGQHAEPPRTDQTLPQTLDASFAYAEKTFVPALEAMPEAQYAFAPTQGEFKGVRTFAAQARHVGAVNYLVAAVILGEKPPVDVARGDGPAALKDKAEVLAYVKGSYAYAHKAMRSITEGNALASIKSPFGEGMTSRTALATMLLAHTMDHYGQVAVYLRMNGVVPPASR